VRAARKLGYSRPTVWRYLARFEKLGLVVHEGKFYRKDPLHGSSLKPSPEVFAIETRGKLLYAPPVGGVEYVAKLRDAAIHTENKVWQPPDEYLDAHWNDPKIVRTFFTDTILNSLLGYLGMLAALTTIRDPRSASEVAGILIDAEVKPCLMSLAGLVWARRNQRILETLDGEEIGVKIRHVKLSREQAAGKELPPWS